MLVETTKNSTDLDRSPPSLEGKTTKYICFVEHPETRETHRQGWGGAPCYAPLCERHSRHYATHRTLRTGSTQHQSDMPVRRGQAEICCAVQRRVTQPTSHLFCLQINFENCRAETCFFQIASMSGNSVLVHALLYSMLFNRTEE